MKQVILGHLGMVGSALHRRIPDALTVPRDQDLRGCSHQAARTMQDADVVYLCAARTGGIGKNIAEPGTMIYDNLAIQTNVIETARIAGVKLFVFLGSSCIYPGTERQPPGWREEDLLCFPLEPTNEPYAVAKIAGIKMLEAYKRQYGMEYLAVMPCNLYGPGDNFDPETAHFMPAMIRKFHDAKVWGANTVTLWGTGKPRRELMHVDDCARIVTELVAKNARGLMNVGWGADATIAEWAAAVSAIVAPGVTAEFDCSGPDGVSSKLLDVSRMKSFGCAPRIGSDGIESTYRWFLEHRADLYLDRPRRLREV